MIKDRKRGSNVQKASIYLFTFRLVDIRERERKEPIGEE